MKTQSITWTDDTITISYSNGKQFRGNCLELPTGIFEACAAARSPDPARLVGVAHESPDRVARTVEGHGAVGADEAGGPGDEDLHVTEATSPVARSTRNARSRRAVSRTA